MGEAGCAAVRTLVATLRHEFGLDAVIANGENSASGGRGITPESGSDLLSVVDFLTLGSHAFDAGGAGRFLEWETWIIRPANLEADSPGYGWGKFEAGGVWVAGPDSGKTRVLALRVLRLAFVDGADRRAILATTFTKKAATELRSRILSWGDKLRHALLADPDTTAGLELVGELRCLDLNRVTTGTLDTIARYRWSTG